ncbi:oxidoreductase [Halomonas sp. 1390]|uniref:oxidoreductase n=1 Tax=Halomonas sp. B23F22_3 TaxID=3459516 RepID=UPI00373EA330
MSTGFIVRLLAPLLCLLIALSHAQAHSHAPAHPQEQPMPLPGPTDRVILTLSGDIAYPNVGDEAHFDRAMLEALPSRVIETHTPWHSDKGRFEGPLVRALLDTVGADGDSLRIRALNDFEAQAPRSDFYDHDVILAMSRDGEPLGIRDFGPLFVVYPFDAHPELLTEAVRFRSVWHVERIIVP